MKQYSYDELKAEVEKRKKEQSNILGHCCNCNTDVFKDGAHITHYLNMVEQQYCCLHCESYEIEALVFNCILACVQGTKSWDVFKKLKEMSNV